MGGVRPPRADLGVRPTPVRPFVIRGTEVLVKCDNETSQVYGGNKARSLEFLLAGSPKRLLTFSTLHAHHAWATILHGETVGAKTDVVLWTRGERGELARRVHERAARVLEARTRTGVVAAGLRLWRPGTRVIPPGGVSARGALGYLYAAFELDPIPAHLYVPVGTGTTVSGLLAGLMLREADIEVVAIRVADALAAWPSLLWRRAFAAARLARRCDPTLPVPRRGRVRLRVEVHGAPYGEPDAATLDVRAEAAAAGLALETTYTAPALSCLLRERRPGAMLLNTYAPASPCSTADAVESIAP